MPRKRRREKRRLPQGLAEISGLELNTWAVYGPNVGDVPVVEGWHTWPSWAEWAEFYRLVREEYLAKRRALRVPAAERIYQAMQQGKDPDEERSAIVQEMHDNDPRRLLGKG